MSKGTKDFFRHSFIAHKDVQINEFMRLLGRNWQSAYFYYFSLLEHCSSTVTDLKDVQTEHKLHTSTVRSLWRTSAKGVNSVCKLLTQSELVVCKVSTNCVVFYIPNLPKYLGSVSIEKSRIEKKRIDNTIEEENSNSTAHRGSDTTSKSKEDKLVLSEDQKSVKLGRKHDRTFTWLFNEGFNLEDNLQELFPSNKRIKKELSSLLNLALKKLDDDESNINDFDFWFLHNLISKSKYN